MTGQDFQDRGNESRNFFVSWHLLVSLIWRIRSENSPPSVSLLEGKDFSLLLVEHEDSGRIEPLTFGLIPNGHSE